MKRKTALYLLMDQIGQNKARSRDAAIRSTIDVALEKEMPFQDACDMINLISSGLFPGHRIVVVGRWGPSRTYYDMVAVNNNDPYSERKVGTIASAYKDGEQIFWKIFWLKF